MAKGRGSASWSAQAIVALMLVSVLVLQADYVQAATYTVGESNGWAFNAVGWPSGKHFKAGDVLGIHTSHLILKLPQDSIILLQI